MDLSDRAPNAPPDPRLLSVSADRLLAAALKAMPDGAEWLERARLGLAPESNRVIDEHWHRTKEQGDDQVE